MLNKTLALVALCALVLASAAAATANLSGTWKTDMAKSDFGAMPAPQSNVSNIDHADPKLVIATTSVGNSGERTFTLTFSTDGAETTNEVGSVQIKSKARWEGNDLLIDSKATTDQGEFTVKDRWSLAEDGKTLTLVRQWSGPMGEAKQTLIHQKQ